jgi:hypothetical protein
MARSFYTELKPNPTTLALEYVVCHPDGKVMKAFPRMNLSDSESAAERFARDMNARSAAAVLKAGG